VARTAREFKEEEETAAKSAAEGGVAGLGLVSAEILLAFDIHHDCNTASALQSVIVTSQPSKAPLYYSGSVIIIFYFNIMAIRNTQSAP
jgi:hypothetical protein